MSNYRHTYIFNTGGVEWSAAELEAVLTDGDAIYQYGEDEPEPMDSGEGWEGWSELSYGDHYVRIDGVDHKIEVVSEDDGGSYSYDEFVVFVLEGRFFRVDGHYESYNGSDWTELREVTKGTKTVEVYE